MMSPSPRHFLPLLPLLFLLFLAGRGHCQVCVPVNGSIFSSCTCTNDAKRNCGGGNGPKLICSNLPGFDPQGYIFPDVDCLVITHGQFKTINSSHMRQFPNLRGLIITDSRLNHITPTALDSLTNLVRLDLINNELTTFPSLNLPNLNFIDVPNNHLTGFDDRTFAMLPKLARLIASHNDIEELRGPIFSSCSLTHLDLSHNPLRVVEDEALSGSFLEILDLSYTLISQVPAPLSVRQHLQALILNGTWELTRFSLLSEDTSYDNLTFPFLRKVEFAYHAHCCQMKRLQIRSRVGLNMNLMRIRKRSVNGAEPVRPVQLERGREYRQIGDAKPMKEAIRSELSLKRRQLRQKRQTPMIQLCLNVTSQECHINPSNLNFSDPEVQIYVNADDFCSAFQSCVPCLSEVCPQGCATPSNDTGSGDASQISSSSGGTIDEGIVCLIASTPPTVQPSPTIPPTIRSSPTLPVSSPVPQSELNSSPVPIPSPSRVLRTSTFSITINRTLCPSPSASLLVSATPAVMPTIPDPSPCPVEEVVANCTGVVEGPSMPPPTSTPSPCDCSSYNDQGGCESCRNTGCHSSSCFTQFIDMCHCISQQKRSIENLLTSDYQFGEFSDKQTLEDVDVEPAFIENDLQGNKERIKRSEDSDLSSSGDDNGRGDYFEVDFGNFSRPVICRGMRPDSTPSPSNFTPSSGCSNVTIPLKYTTFGDLAECTPSNDSFNPCNDLLGEEDHLRRAIWFVAILAILGNGLVILIFIGYSVIIRKCKQEIFVISFLYFNLALADFLMGVYLLIIASVDAHTRGEFFFTDIEWRRGHLCEFAGFTAITSTVVSVYVLVVVTLERTYTIVKVLKHKKLSKSVAAIIMAIGWVLGVFLAMLPLIGVSDYNTVAICLPFNVEGNEDKGYVVTLLLATGIAFTFIAVCYCIIFYVVFFSRKSRPFQDTRKRRIGEMKIAIRIFILVFTNFICWFPIALVGLSAIFDNSFVPDLNFALWAMVFIFPINACLNPILYSLTTRRFRENFVLLFNQCGLFKDKAQNIRNHRAGITPSFQSRASETSAFSTKSRGSIVERLRLFSLISQSSTTDLLGNPISRRRGSVMSQSSDENNRIAFLNSRRRSSALSSGSSEDIIRSRRESTLSGDSSDELITNPGFRSTSPDGIATTMFDGSANISVRPRGGKISTSSLGAVPEEVEVVDVVGDQNVVKMNPAYEEEEEEGPEGGKFQKDHQVTSHVTEVKVEVELMESNQRDSGMIEGSDQGGSTESGEDTVSPSNYQLDQGNPDSDIESGSGQESIP